MNITEFCNYLTNLGYKFCEDNDINVEMNSEYVLFQQIQNDDENPRQWKDCKWWVIGFNNFDEVDKHITSVHCGGNGGDSMRLFYKEKDATNVINQYSNTDIHDPNEFIHNDEEIKGIDISKFTNNLGLIVNIIGVKEANYKTNRNDRQIL